MVIGVAGVFNGIDKYEFYLVRLNPNQSPAQTSLGAVTSEVSISPAGGPTLIRDGYVSILPWWGWILVAHIAIALVELVRFWNIK